MNTQVKHLPSGKTFSNRKEAKLMMGHGYYNRALKNGDMVFVTSYSINDIIL